MRQKFALVVKFQPPPRRADEYFWREAWPVGAADDFAIVDGHALAAGTITAPNPAKFCANAALFGPR
jgi:hypothetical protein